MQAPDFEVLDDAGEKFRLSSLRGHRVVLYFYPRANTPGCTVEAQEFRDAIRQFARKKVTVLGISPDTPKAQTSFKTKFDLPFKLLCDTDKAVAKAYGVLQEKNMYGKKVMGIVRSTFVIGPDGEIEKSYSKVTARGHAEEVLCAL
jgi:peroxiredoxin Q/BCP